MIVIFFTTVARQSAQRALIMRPHGICKSCCASPAVIALARPVHIPTHSLSSRLRDLCLFRSTHFFCIAACMCSVLRCGYEHTCQSRLCMMLVPLRAGGPAPPWLLPCAPRCSYGLWCELVSPYSCIVCTGCASCHRPCEACLHSRCTLLVMHSLPSRL